MIRKIYNYTSVLFSLTVILVLLAGLRLRRFELITAEHGLGNIFGIVGTLLMLALFIYPLRKRYQWLKFVGSVQTWFRIHMIFGVIGPVCILLHGNFHLGSFNSNVALFSTLIIAISGIIGRYIYGKIHYGLYGRQVTLTEIKDNLCKEEEQARIHFAQIPEIRDQLISLADDSIASSVSFIKSAGHIFIIKLRTLMVQWKTTRMLNYHLARMSKANNWTEAETIQIHIQLQDELHRILSHSVTVSQFAFFERLFSIWHVLHIPSVYILAAVVIVHIIAVNLF